MPDGVEINTKKKEHYYDRHLASSEILQGNNPSSSSIDLHSTMDYNTAAKLVQKAMYETKMTGDLDDLFMLLGIPK